MTFSFNYNIFILLNKNFIVKRLYYKTWISWNVHCSIPFHLRTHVPRFPLEYWILPQKANWNKRNFSIWSLQLTAWLVSKYSIELDIHSVFHQYFFFNVLWNHTIDTNTMSNYEYGLIWLSLCRQSRSKSVFRIHFRFVLSIVLKFLTVHLT